MSKIKSYLFTGLIVVIPVLLTVYLLFVFFTFLDNILGRFLRHFFVDTFGFYLPGAGFLLFVLMILLVGFAAKRLLRHRIAMSFERGFAGLPLIKYIYPAVKQVVLFVSQQKELGFKKVAMVEYPRKGVWCLGFLTNEQFGSLNRSVSRDLVSVYIPTTPGPLSGSVFFFPREEVLFPDITVNEALNIIISGGVFKKDEEQMAKPGEERA